MSGGGAEAGRRALRRAERGSPGGSRSPAVQSCLRGGRWKPPAASFRGGIGEQVGGRRRCCRQPAPLPRGRRCFNAASRAPAERPFLPSACRGGHPRRRPAGRRSFPRPSQAPRQGSQQVAASRGRRTCPALVAPCKPWGARCALACLSAVAGRARAAQEPSKAGTCSRRASRCEGTGVPFL